MAVKLINYTLAFFMWLIIGRVLLALIAGGSAKNAIMVFFEKFTEPLYRAVEAAFPFIGVPRERRDTAWGRIRGFVPFVAVSVILVARIALILVFSPGR